MADHVLSTHQLSLFIDPEEHIANMPRSTDAYAESMPEMWSRKETESREPEGYGHGSGLYDRIKAGEQIRNPIQVQLGHSTYLDRQYEGHHRAAAGAAVQRENREEGKPNPQVHIPVEYTQQHGSPNWLEDRRLDMAGAGMWMTPEEKDDRHVEVQNQEPDGVPTAHEVLRAADSRACRVGRCSWIASTDQGWWRSASSRCLWM